MADFYNGFDYQSIFLNGNDPAGIRALNRFRHVVAAPAWLGLPALDGGAKALVRICYASFCALMRA
jgi:hypothetical protein